MRLEEWQKFIESQFLDEAAENAAQQERLAAEAQEKSVSVPTATEADAVAVFADIPADAPALALPLAETPAVEPANVTEAQEAPNVRPFEAALDFNAELPAFENYLPAFRSAPSGTSQVRPLMTEPAIAAPAPEPPQPVTAAPQNALAQPAQPVTAAPQNAVTPPPQVSIATAQTPQAVTALPRNADVPRPEQTLPPAVAGLFDTETTEPTPVPPHSEPQTENHAAMPERRGSRPRARHARNVRPEPAGGLSAELWAKAPRHLQALLALEKLQQEEIAQSSYKRPFTEGRRELIERLLDPVLSLEDTARLLGVCPTTVRRYTNRGILTHYRKEPRRTTKAEVETETGKETRQRRFRLSDILTFLETQQSALEADRRSEKERAQRKISDTRTAVPSS